MKKYLTILILSLSSVAFAATTDFVADGNVIVSSVTGDGVTSNLTIVSGSKAESSKYDNGVFTVTNPDSALGFKVQSDTGRSIRVSLNGTEVACEDNANPGMAYVSLPISVNTYTVYASRYLCAVTSHGSSGYVGGRTTSTLASAISVSAKICNGGELFSTSTTTGKTCTTIASTTPATVTLFTKDLKSGMKDTEVKLLQQYLNNHGFAVTLSGAGSAKHETTLFGGATKAALIKFQKANKISPAVGFFGSLTRVFVNSH